jgi:DNA-binding CsgD family transcriptional regulator/PAS domain-containing protein
MVSCASGMMTCLQGMSMKQLKNLAKQTDAAAMTSELPEILELIYHAAINPTGWNPLLHRLASLTDCVAAGITIENPVTKKGRPITYFGFDTGHVEKTFDHYLPMNPLFSISQSMTTGFIVANGDVIAPRDFAMTDFYNGWAKPQGIGSPLTLVLDHGENFYCPLTLVRPDGKGEATSAHRQLLRIVSPHLTRAMKVHLKLEASDARLEATDAAFENAGLAVFMLDAHGHVVFCNRRAEDYLRDGTVLAAPGGVLNASVAGDNRRLQQAIAKASCRMVPSGAGFAITGNDQRLLSVSIIPVPPSGLLHPRGRLHASCVMIVSDPDMRHAHTIQKLARSHGLTQAEIRVMKLILTGAGIADAAQALSISVETVRTHLKRIFSKTGTTRQAELVRLFMDARLRGLHSYAASRS